MIWHSMEFLQERFLQPECVITCNKHCTVSTSLIILIQHTHAISFHLSGHKALYWVGEHDNTCKEESSGIGNWINLAVIIEEIACREKI